MTSLEQPALLICLYTSIHQAGFGGRQGCLRLCHAKPVRLRIKFCQDLAAGEPFTHVDAQLGDPSSCFKS